MDGMPCREGEGVGRLDRMRGGCDAWRVAALASPEKNAAVGNDRGVELRKRGVAQVVRIAARRRQQARPSAPRPASAAHVAGSGTAETAVTVRSLPVPP